MESNQDFVQLSNFRGLAQRIVKMNLAPEWVAGSPDNPVKEEQQVDLLELTFMAGHEIGMSWVEAMQSLLFFQGYVCVRAHTARALVKKHQNVDMIVKTEGSIKDRNYRVVCSTMDGKFETHYGFDELVNAGYYDPEYKKGQGQMPISQKFPERTAIAKAVAYHYRDYHKVLGVEILEEIQSYDYFKTTAVQVESGAGKLSIGNSKETGDQVKSIIAEGQEKRDPGLANPLVEPKQVDLEESIAEIESESKTIPHLDMKKAMNMNYNMLRDWVIEQGFIEFVEEVEALPKKKTNKKLREAYQALEMGEWDRWKADYLAENGEEEEKKDEPAKQEPVKEAPTKTDADQEAAPKGPQLWFWNPHTDNLFIRPLRDKAEYSEKYELLGMAKKCDIDEGRAMLNAFLEEHQGKKEKPENKKEVSMKIDISIPESTPRSNDEVFRLFQDISDFTCDQFPEPDQFYDAVQADVTNNGHEIDVWLSNTSADTIMSTFHSCLSKA